MEVSSDLIGKLSGISNNGLDDAHKRKFQYPKKLSRKDSNIIVKGTIPYKREDIINWYGWGYKDSYFYIEEGNGKFSGKRYDICHKSMPFFYPWMERSLNMKIPVINYMPTFHEMPKEDEYPQSKITNTQMKALERLDLKVSYKGSDRLVRSHGQCLNEIESLQTMSMERIPDAVIWPNCHEDVIEIVRVCNEQGIVIIPYGGGTSVSEGVSCPKEEGRPILSMDTCMMNEILWVDHESLLICCESGIIGQDLERELQKIGYTCGHEPDSMEFSTVGGWVATRASGMKKNDYGNIEDIVVHVRMVTPSGVLEKGTLAPRISSGPDFNHVVIGSEGCFGVITEVCMKIRPLPVFKKFGSLVFPNFESGFKFMREVAKQRLQPASIRYLDNEQFQLGRTLREELSAVEGIVEEIKTFYLTKIKGFDMNQITFVTLLYEGEKDDVLNHERKINSIAAQYCGIAAGETNGRKGYNLTYVIAYLRDVALDFGVVAESAETSVPWEKALEVIRLVKEKIHEEAKKLKIPGCVATCRIAQTYDSGCCIYFYFIVNPGNTKDKKNILLNIEEIAKDVIVAAGASVSHHHGVGKARSKWYEQTVSTCGLDLFKVCKSHLDPNNVFGVGNLSCKL